MSDASRQHLLSSAMHFKPSAFVPPTTSVLLRRPQLGSISSSFTKSYAQVKPVPTFTTHRAPTGTTAPRVTRFALFATLASPHVGTAAADDDGDSNTKSTHGESVAVAEDDANDVDDPHHNKNSFQHTAPSVDEDGHPTYAQSTIAAPTSSALLDSSTASTGSSSNSNGIHEDHAPEDAHVSTNFVNSDNFATDPARADPSQRSVFPRGSDQLLDLASQMSLGDNYLDDDMTAAHILIDDLEESHNQTLGHDFPSNLNLSAMSSDDLSLTSKTSTPSDSRRSSTPRTSRTVDSYAAGTNRAPASEQATTPPPELGRPLSEFRISKTTLDRLAKNGITHATEVQAGTFNTVYDGSDIIAKSRTGTGKTLAFAIPIMERLAIIRKEKPRLRGQGPGVIVLAPTRELAKQVAREMAYIGEGLNLSVECFYGGTSYTPQESALRRGIDVAVGTPGRIIDHMNRGTLRLDSVCFAVLDEADEMLSMGFAEDVEIVFQTLPPVGERQVILFSATVPGWVKNLASQYQREDVVTFDGVSKGSSLAATTVRHCAVRVPERAEARAGLLADIIAVYSRSKDGTGPSRAIVFCETKREADELATSGSLDGCGAAVLHGDVSQKQREVTLAQFRQGKFQVLVATDVAARGLDISGVDVVVQYRVPQDAEAYIHRSGRTGRAGKAGTAVVMFSDREQQNIRQLERSCNIQFVREAAPSPELALEAAVDVAVSNMGSVDLRVVNHLIPRAEQMLEDAEKPAELLASILAIAGRRIQLPDRSVLSGENGMRTLLVKGASEVSPGLAIRFISELSRRIGCDDRVGLIRICRNGAAAVDVPSHAAEAILNGAKDSTIVRSSDLTVEYASSIPALKDEDRRGSSGGRGGRDRGRSGSGGSRRGSRDRYGASTYSRAGGYGRDSRDSYSRDNGNSRSNRNFSDSRDGYSDYRRGYSDMRGSRTGREEGGARSDRDFGRSYRDDAGRSGSRRKPEFLSDDF